MKLHPVAIIPCVLTLLAGGCFGAKHDASGADASAAGGNSAPPDDDGDYTEPEFPEQVDPGSEYADSCEISPEGTCRAFVKYGCAGGGSCGVDIPCDPSLCASQPAEGLADTSSTGTP